MGMPPSRINLGKVSERYAKRRANTSKGSYNDSVAQLELLRILDESTPSIQHANRILDADAHTKEIVVEIAEQSADLNRRTY
jgi:hypothetical protein